MLEAGFARSRESINILVEGIVDTCICGVTFWAWGFAFMFEPGNGFIGTTGYFLNGLPETYLTTGILAYGVDSHYRGGVKLETPDLDIAYKPIPIPSDWKEVLR